MQTATAPGAFARLGYVLNWAGIAIGLGFGGFIAIAVAPIATVWQLIFGVAGFLCCYTIGRGLRLILAGR